MNAPEHPHLEPQQISTEVLIEKYAKNGETTLDEVRSRVARAFAQVEPVGEREELEAQFLWAQRNGFVLAGRINSAAGTDIRATPINCFVQPVGDAMTGADEEGVPGIMPAMAMAAETMRRGGGVGYASAASAPRAPR